MASVSAAAGEKQAAQDLETPPPAEPAALRTGLRARLRRPHLAVDKHLLRLWLRDVILPIIAIRIAIMVAGYFALTVFQPERLSEGLAMWNHWDGPNFQILSQWGYGPGTPRPEFIVLFPLYPLTISIGNAVLPLFETAMLSSLVATLFAGVGLYELVRLDSNRSLARGSVLAMVLFPSAYSLVAPYSEPLFLATTVWAFVAMRRGHVAASGVLALLAALTRIQGAFLIPALGVEYLMVRRRIRWDILWIALIAAGPLIYLGINWYYFGSPMHFVSVQDQIYHVANGMPWVTMPDLWNHVVNEPQNERWVTVFVAPLAAFVLLAVVTIWSIFSKHSRPSYAVYTAITGLSFTTLTWPISVPRYIMGVFPIFIAMASWGRRPGGQAVLVLSTLLLGMFMTLFLMLHWAF